MILVHSCGLYNTYRVVDLKIEPMNVAIPVALIGENDEGQLEFTFYVQLRDGFLSKVHLQQAVEASLYRSFSLRIRD